MATTSVASAARTVTSRVAGLGALVGTSFVIASLCYLTSPVLVVALSLAVGFLVLACTRPVAAVCVTLLLVVTQGLSLPLGGIGELSTTEWAFLVVAGGWVWRALSGSPGVCFPQIADYPLIALVLALLPGLVLGADPVDVLRLLVMWTAFFLVYLTVKGFTPDQLRTVVIALGVGAGLLACAGVVTYLQGGGTTLYDGGAGVSGRAAFAIPDPNYYGGYLVLAATPLAALVVGRGTRWRWSGGLVVAACVLALFATLSRGALLAAALAAAVVLISWSHARIVTTGIALALLCATAINVNPLLDATATEVVSERLSSVGVESSNNKRTLIWAESLEVVRQHPEGVGALRFREVSASLGLTERGDPLENVHNTYLNIAVELGLLGLLAYLIWCARVARDLWVEWRRRRPQTFPLVVGLSGAFAGYAFQALTIVQYRVQTIFATLFVLAGAAAAARAWSGPEQPEPVLRPLPSSEGAWSVRAGS